MKLFFLLSMFLCTPAHAAPSFITRDINGEIIDIAGQQDKIVMLNFWATWCSPCMAEMPHLQELKDKYKDDLVFISINVDEARNASKIKPFLRRQGYDFTVIHDRDRSITAIYNPQMVLPYNVIINHNGSIIWQEGGYQTGQELVFNEILATAIKKITTNE
jgi:thiol-disulfide isomerase/thioredoxin